MNLHKGLHFGLEVSSLVGRQGSSVLGLREPCPVLPCILSQGLLCLRLTANKGEPAFWFQWTSVCTLHSPDLRAIVSAA